MTAIYKKHHLLHTDMSANTRMGSGLVMAPITTRMEDLLLVRINHQPYCCHGQHHNTNGNDFHFLHNMMAPIFWKQKLLNIINIISIRCQIWYIWDTNIHKHDYPHHHDHCEDLKHQVSTRVTSEKVLVWCTTLVAGFLLILVSPFIIISIYHHQNLSLSA